MATVPPFEYEPRFISDLVFKDEGGLPFTLVQNLVYVTNVNHRGTFTVLSGFKTDLASIPRGLWNILPKFGKYDAAAVVHDYLYQQPSGAPYVTRAQADSTLYEAMGVLSVTSWQRWAIYLGVRMGGWATWNKYRTNR